MPNLSANAPGSTSTKSVSKDEKINAIGAILHDIEESPTPTLSSHGEISSPGPNNQETEMKTPLIPLPRIEYTTEEEEAISKAPELTEKRNEPLKTPKSYFFESLQKRRNRALKKSQSAARFLTNAGPNLIRRGSTIRFLNFLPLT